MADLYSKERRSEIMSRIRAKDTTPEVRVRRLLHKMGYRFRLHRKDLPGKPDIVLPKWRTVIHVHGCFWHGHTCCEGHVPKSNRRYWTPKLKRNARRDSEHAAELRELGWNQIVIWECETGNLQTLERQLRREMGRVRCNKIKAVS
jgi:DNA mismatch endonuclease (patch repair protein)